MGKWALKFATTEHCIKEKKIYCCQHKEILFFVTVIGWHCCLSFMQCLLVANWKVHMLIDKVKICGWQIFNKLHVKLQICKTQGFTYKVLQIRWRKLYKLFTISKKVFVLVARLWYRITFLLNFFSQLFHVVAWSCVSILRYLYIVKTDWLHQTFPDPAKLKVWGINYHLIIILIFYYDKLRSIGPKVHKQIKDVANSSK